MNVDELLRNDERMLQKDDGVSRDDKIFVKFSIIIFAYATSNMIMMLSLMIKKFRILLIDINTKFTFQSVLKVILNIYYNIYVVVHS